MCGIYDHTKRGVWELYLSDINSTDGSMAPGVHFFDLGFGNFFGQIGEIRISNVRRY